MTEPHLRGGQGAPAVEGMRVDMTAAAATGDSFPFLGGPLRKLADGCLLA